MRQSSPAFLARSIESSQDDEKYTRNDRTTHEPAQGSLRRSQELDCSNEHHDDSGCGCHEISWSLTILVTTIGGLRCRAENPLCYLRPPFGQGVQLHWASSALLHDTGSHEHTHVMRRQLTGQACLLGDASQVGRTSHQLSQHDGA